MKKFILGSIAIFTTFFSFAQAPEKMSYQAIVRDNNNQLVVNQAISMKIGIYRNSTSGTLVYEEVHSPTTNVNGLASLQIGTGTVIAGSIDTIRWENGPYFLKREIDLSGGTNYNITGSSEMVSVPYALYSKKVENFAGGDYKLNYAVPTITSTSNQVTILTTNQNWEGDRRIMMNGYVLLEFDFPTVALSNNITSGTANIDLYLKYDSQTIMPANFKNIRVNHNAHVSLPIMAMIPLSTAGNLKQFKIVCPGNQSKTDAISTPSANYGPYEINVKVTVVMSWMEL